LQPSLEVLNANRMFGLRMFYLNGDRRLTEPNPVDPFIVAKDSQRLGDCLVEAAGADLDRVLNSAKVNAGTSAGLQGHISQLHIRFYSPSEEYRSRPGFFRPLY
jgi:hypothetical protein